MNEVIAIGIGIIVFIFAIERDGKKKYKNCKSIGDIGESIVANKLKQLDDKFVVKNNVHIGNCQIDHLVINNECSLVFVIETKMWGGIITGGISDDMWKQDKNGVMNYFDNPIKQNKYHCNIVRKHYSGYEIINLVVFVGNKNVPKSKYIISKDELVEYITSVYNRVYNGCIMNV